MECNRVLLPPNPLPMNDGPCSEDKEREGLYDKLASYIAYIIHSVVDYMYDESDARVQFEREKKHNTRITHVNLLYDYTE